jgi:Xaa-Pro dipeptidase
LEILDEKKLKGSRIGIELRTFGLTGDKYELVRRRLDGWCELVDASHVIRGLRLIKSEAELTYVRRAAELADQSLSAMLSATRPGAFEGEIAAAGSVPILAGGGDPPPSGPVLGSGERALLIRSSTGFRHLDPIDQLTMEFAASYRHYCACLMRTVAVGKPSSRQQHMFEVTREAIMAMTEAARPGRPLGEIDDAHRRVYDAAGFSESRMSACGYSLGALYRPTWMDVPPMLYSGNPMPAAPGMVLFLHAILVDAPSNLAMSLGHTIAITVNGPEILSRIQPEYHVCT